MDPNLFYGMLFGLSLGAAQCIALRLSTPFKIIWILANTAAWTLSFALLRVVGFDTIFILPGIVVGFVSGLLLIWFARRPVQETK